MGKISNFFKALKWFDWVYLATFFLMILLLFIEKKFGLKGFGLAIGITLFTIFTIFAIIFGKKEGRKIYPENIIFLLMFIGYSILSFSLALKQAELISPLILLISIFLVVGFFFGMAIIIWFRFLIKNKGHPLFLVFTYLVLTFLIITLFVGFYMGIGEIGFNGEVINKENLNRVDYYHLSVASFTGLGYGDYYPVGKAKIVSLTESYFSMFFNVVVIGVIISRFSNKRKLNKVLDGTLKIKGIGKKTLEKLKKYI